MSTLVVHESQWGNTRAVAEAVADALPGGELDRARAWARSLPQSA